MNNIIFYKSILMQRCQQNYSHFLEHFCRICLVERHLSIMELTVLFLSVIPFLWKENYTYFHSFMLVKLLKITLSLFETFWKLWIFAKNFKMQPILWNKFLKLCLFFLRIICCSRKKIFVWSIFFQLQSLNKSFSSNQRKKHKSWLLIEYLVSEWLKNDKFSIVSIIWNVGVRKNWKEFRILKKK